MRSIEDKILGRIYGRGRGSVFVPSDFLDLGSRQAVGLALHRLVKKGVVRHLARGLYDYPQHDPRLGVLSPSTEAIAKALAGKYQLRLQPSGAYAANLLGLSEQVPMKVVFLTDGPSKRVQVGGKTIILKHKSTRDMATAGRLSGLVIQALRYLGQQHVDDQKVAVLRWRLRPEDKRSLLQDVRLAPAWIGKVIRQVATEQEE